MNKCLQVMLSVVLLCTFLCFFVACSNHNDVPTTYNYISVNGEKLSAEYFGYFFYLAQSSMLSEAGHTSENSTDEDIETYWKTTEIEGKNAVEVARDVAVDNAVSQKVQYFAALQNGIELSADEQASIDAAIEQTVSDNGGSKAFEDMLVSMGTNIEAYKQIITENVYIQNLYNKLDSEGALSVSEDEIAAFTEAHSADYLPEEMLDLAKKDKFNAMAKQWESEAKIEIDDEAIKQFKII